MPPATKPMDDGDERARHRGGRAVDNHGCKGRDHKWSVPNQCAALGPSSLWAGTPLTGS